jgi:hypothetical protein
LETAPRETSSEKLYFALGLAASLAILAVIAWPMTAGKLYTLDDLGNMHIPFRFFFARCLADGSNPSWFPDLFCGVYLQGDGQVGMYHPLHRFLYTFLPFEQAFNFELFITYPMMLLGTYLFLRRWAVTRGAAVFGAMLFTFSGFNLLHFMHMHCIAIIAQMPWLLVAVDMSIRGSAQERLFGNFLVTLLTASQILLGHMQFVWFSSLAEFSYVLFLVRSWRLATVLSLALAKVLGLVVASVQLIPSAESFLASQRNVATYSPSMLSLPPANLIQLVAPYAFKGRIVMLPGEANTQEYGIYCGAVTLTLFVWAVAAGFRRGRADSLSKWSFVLALVALVLTLGVYGGLYPMLSKLPFVGWFRAPCRYIVLAQFAMSVTCAVAFSRLSSGERGGRGLFLVSLPVLAVAALAAIGLLPLVPTLRNDFLMGYAATGALAWAGPLLFLLAAILVIVAARGSTWALGTLILFAAVDQAFYGLSFVKSWPVQTLEELAGTVRVPGHPAEQRIDIHPTTDDVATLSGHKLVWGFVGLVPAKTLDYTDPTVLRLASAAYRIVKHDAPAGAASEPGGLTLERIDNPLPRARLVSDCVVQKGQVSLEGINVDTTAVVSDAAETDARASGSVTVLADAPGRMSLSTECTGRQLLVVSESYHPGWKATIDGAPSRVLRAYGDFIAIGVPMGTHRVDLVFDPDSLRRAGRLSVAGLATACLWCLLASVSLRFRSRRLGAGK